MKTPTSLPWTGYVEYPADEMVRRAEEFREEMARRRSVRAFSSREVPRSVVENAVLAASSAPSGANQQPWHFVVVSELETKRRIRLAAEQEEREFYERRAPDDWLAALAPLGTDAEKPFLEVAPYLIVVFSRSFDVAADGRRIKHYYVSESVGIASGILITALHHSGLATLTHTPSPMKFLNTILDRPPREKPYLLIVTGYPEPGVRVPAISRKSFEEIATFVEPAEASNTLAGE